MEGIARDSHSAVDIFPVVCVLVFLPFQVPNVLTIHLVLGFG
jgi:hypothetical protein